MIGARRSRPARRVRRCEALSRLPAVVNYISSPTLEEGQAGTLAGLQEAGFVDGENLNLQFYNAEGDRPTAILIAKEATSGTFDRVITLSTPVLQAVAGSNQDTQMHHIFTLTTDPWGAGIGIDREAPSKHPPYMTGIGTLQPIEAVLRAALQANPKLNRVGVVWNPAEPNSEASTIKAREVCKKLGIESLESTVESSTAVLDGTKALMARDVQAFWVGGDSTVSAALDTLIANARDGDVPVFTSMPADIERGALFCLGADYETVGHASGLIAGRVLAGADPAQIPVENYAPEEFAINAVEIKNFQPTWKFPSDWRSRAQTIVDSRGVNEQLTNPNQ